LSGERWRLFVAAPLGTPAAEAIWAALAELRAHHPDARWLPPEQLHATLAFLGATDPVRVAGIVAAVRRATGASRRFDTMVGGAGGRPAGRRGGVAWLRLVSGGSGLTDLALTVDRELGSALYSGAIRPRPHVTVVRRVDEPLLAGLRATAGQLNVPWAVERVVLYRSHTSSRGSTYEELVTVDLAPT
jgi:RNA 2',3'-cyclic 3'-phosphodiesterase